MPDRATLHRLLDELGDDDLPTAERLLVGLRATADPLNRSLLAAPIDDEPETDDEKAAVAEALREIEEGVPGIPQEELERRWGVR